MGWLTQIAAGRAPRPAFTPLVGAVAFLLTGLALSALVATDLALAAKEMLKWVELAAVYLAGTSLLQTRAQRRTLLDLAPRGRVLAGPRRPAAVRAPDRPRALH